MKKLLTLGLTAAMLSGMASAGSAGETLTLGQYGFKVKFEPSQNAWAEQYRLKMQKENIFPILMEALGRAMRLKQTVPITFKDCGMVNAYWSPDDKNVSMCYEIIERIKDNYPAIAKKNALVREAGLNVVLKGTIMTVLLHEVGHGLVDLYKLPVTGKEEDAVDQFATVLIASLDREFKQSLSANVIYGAEFFKSLSPEKLDRSDFADFHALGEQRYYDMQCYILGYDPERYGPILASAMMKAIPVVTKLLENKASADEIQAAIHKDDDQNIIPVDRAQTCDDEWKKIEYSWDTLLGTFMK